jgi:hypothetical protein
VGLPTLTAYSSETGVIDREMLTIGMRVMSFRSQCLRRSRRRTMGGCRLNDKNGTDWYLGHDDPRSEPYPP